MGEFPSKENQFSKDNQPANNGRKKGSKNLTTILREMMNMTLSQAGIVPYFHKDAHKLCNEAIISVLVKKAFINGNDKSIQEVIDRLEGKPLQTQVVEAQGMELLKVVFVDGRIKNNDDDGDASPQKESSSQDENSS